jgi:hypothetical protein
VTFSTLLTARGSRKPDAGLRSSGELQRFPHAFVA